jgi:hypothetical protein
MKFPGNPLTAIETGAVLDLRARLAISLLQAPLAAELAKFIYAGADATPAPTGAARNLANELLDITEALMDAAETRSLVEPLPDEDAPLSQVVQNHIARSAYANFLGQKMMNDIAQAHMPKVAMPRPGMN